MNLPNFHFRFNDFSRKTIRCVRWQANFHFWNFKFTRHVFFNEKREISIKVWWIRAWHTRTRSCFDGCWTVYSVQLTTRSQHSQECKDPRRQCFRSLWPWPLPFWSKNKSISRTQRGTFLCQVCHASIFEISCRKKTDTQTNRGKNRPPRSPSAWVITFLYAVVHVYRELANIITEE